MSERVEDPPGATARPPAEAVRGLWPLYLGTFFLAAAGGLVFPLLAELQDVHGLPTWGLGLISGLFFVGAVIGQLVFAPLGDRGRARGLLLLGVGLSLVSLGWFAVATELWEFGVARALSGLAAGMYLPAARASLVRADPARTGLLLGRFAGTETGGFIFGPVIGTAIFQVLGLQAPFLLVTAVLAVVLVVLARVEIPGTRTRPGDAHPMAAVRRARLADPFRLLRHRGVVVAVLFQLAIFLPVGIYDALWARYLTDRGASTLLIGLGLSLYGVPFVLAAPWGGRMADRLGPVRSTTIGMLVVVPTTAIYGLLAAPLVITALALAEAIGTAFAEPGVQTAMARACPRDRLTAGQGLSGAVSMLGAGAAAAAAAPLYEAVGPEWLFCGAAAVMAMLVVAAVAVDRAGGRRAVPHPFNVDEPAGAAPDHRYDVETPVGPITIDAPVDVD